MEFKSFRSITGIWLVIIMAVAILTEQEISPVILHEHVPEIPFYADNYSFRPIVTQISSSPGYGTYYFVK